MIQFKRIDHFHICVPLERLEEARKFYSEVIGLQQKYRPDVFGAEGYWFDIAGAELHIGVEPPLPHSIRHTALEVADLEVARRQLTSNGVEVYQESVIPGRNRFSFNDPFGNRMEMLEYEH